MTKGEIIQAALKLMEIDYKNWNTCLEHCPAIRGDRYELSYYVELIESELEEKSDEQ